MTKHISIILTECKRNLFLYLSILEILFEASPRFILSACPSSYNAPVALFISYLLSIMSFDNLFSSSAIEYVSYLYNSMSSLNIPWPHIVVCSWNWTLYGCICSVYGPLSCNNLAHNWQHYRLPAFQFLTFFIIVTLPTFYGVWNMRPQIEDINAVVLIAALTKRWNYWVAKLSSMSDIGLKDSPHQGLRGAFFVHWQSA